MSLPIVMNSRPDALEIAAALMACGGRYVEFRYVNQLPKRNSPSVQAKNADTVFKGEPDMVKAFLDPELTTIRFAETTQNWVITLHTMNRVAKGENGEWARYGYDKGEYTPRCYRMSGIRLDTLLVATNKGKEKLFPNAVGTI